MSPGRFKIPTITELSSSHAGADNTGRLLCSACAMCRDNSCLFDPFATATDDVTKQGGPLRKRGYGYDVSRRPCSDYSSIRILMYVHYQLLKSPWLIRAILSCERTLWRKCQLRHLIMFILTHNFNQ